MKPWTVVLNDRPEPFEMESLGRELLTDIHLFEDGTSTIAHYDYTGLCPRQKVAFARFRERSVWP